MPENEVVWQAKVTRLMVADWSEDEIELLCADLDDAVQSVCDDL